MVPGVDADRQDPGSVALTTASITASARPVAWPWWIPATLAAAFALVALLPVLARPALGPIDDHQLPMIQGQIAAGGVITVLWSYVLETGARFRPLYWIGQFVELQAWGLNAAGWYLDRALLLVLTVIAGTWAFSRLAPTWVAAGVALLLVSGPQADPWFRLGPQEAYAVPLTLGALGCILHERNRAGIALAVLAALTKEVFVVSSLALVLLAWRRGYRSRAGLALVVLAGAAVAVRFLTTPDAYVASRPASFLAEPRYWWPWIIPVGAGIAWLVGRRPVYGVLVVAIALVGLVAANGMAQWWADLDARWSQAIAGIRAPYVVVVDRPDEYERVLAVRRFVAGRASLVLRPVTPATDLDRALAAELATWVRGGQGYAPGVSGDCTAVLFTPGPAPCPKVVLLP